jgi:hypothetical protein
VVTDANLGDRRAYGDDDPGEFVPEDRRHWVAQINGGDGVVGVAQPGRLDVDQDFTVDRFGDGDVLDDESGSGRIHDGCFHICPFRVG